MIIRLFISFVILFFYTLNPVNAQWTPVQYPGSGNDFPDLTAIDFRSPEYGLAISEALIVRTQDSGHNWDTVYQAVNYTLTDIVFANENIIFAIGHKSPDTGCSFEVDQGLLLTSNNAGANWDVATYDFSLHSLTSTSTEVAYIIGSCGRILKTTNAGAVWTELPSISTTDVLRDVSFLTDSIGFICDGTSTLYKTTDGQSFTPVISSQNLLKNKIIFKSEELGFMLGGTSIFRTENGGNTWTIIGIGADVMAEVRDSSILVGKEIGGLLRSDNLGTNWYPQSGNPPLAGSIMTNVIYFFDEYTGFISGPGSFLQYDPPKHTLNGRVFLDEGNCILDGPETGLNDWLIKIDNNGVINYKTSDVSGNYTLDVDTGTYTISVYPPNDYLAPCSNDIVVDLTEENGTTEILFPIRREILCEELEVDISTTKLTRCAENIYTVSFCNKGTINAENVIIDISFAPEIEVLSSDIFGISFGNNTFRYEIGDLEEFECNTFQIRTFLSCEGTVEGQTHHVNAHIFPDSICLPSDPSWDGSSITVKAECIGDSINLQVINSSLLDMTEELKFIIIEDNVLLLQGKFNLGALEDSVFVVYPNGGTIRLEAEQSLGHPGQDQPSVAVEGCGTNLDEDYSRGFILQYPENDANTFLSIDAQESLDQESLVMTSFRSFPKGYGGEHYIKPDTDIEYHVVFQNTGDSIINRVNIQCQASSALNITTITPGASSHIFDFDILNQGTIKFVSPNINLNPGESGFIKFRISQKNQNVPGTVITSYFNINYGEQQAAENGTLTLIIEKDFVPPLPMLQISGTVYTPSGLPLKEVSLNNFDSLLAVSDADGEYLITHPYLIDQTLQVSASNDHHSTEGITAYDLYLLNSNIVNNTPYSSTIDLIIADTDSSESVDQNDLTNIQNHILNFKDNSHMIPWYFLNEQYLSNNDSSSTPLLKGSYDIAIPTRLNKLDFIGLKKGDINKDFQGNSEIEPETVELKVVIRKKSNLVYYDFNLPDKAFLKLLSYQFAFTFDTQYLDIENIMANTTGSFLYQVNKNEGDIVVMWYDDQQNSVVTDSTLFTIQAKQISELPDQELLALIENGSYLEMYLIEDNQGIPKKLKIDFSIESIEYDNNTLGIYPNPTSEKAKIEYTIIENQDIHLQLFNASGQLIRDINEGYKAKGKHIKEIEVSDLPVGVYFLRLTGTDIEIVNKLFILYKRN